MRTNGWAAPFHYLQVITWVFFPSVMGMFFAFTTPLLETSAAYMASIAYGVVCLVVIYAVVRCTATDPSDDSILQRGAGTEGAHQHTQVGEDQLYCNVCVQYVHKESRHCRLCDKCVAVFDHHCKWLNNCVGKKNYRFFLMSVIGATLMLAIQVAFGVYLLALAYSDPSLIKRRLANSYGCSEGKDSTTGLCVDGEYYVPIIAIRAIHAVLLTMLIPWCFLIAQLALFHFQLCFENITTYDYIVRKRKRKLQRDRDNAVRAPWWRRLVGVVCCQPRDPVDDNKQAGDKSSDSRVSRASFDSETEEQAAIEAEVDEDLEVLSARSGEVGERRGSVVQIGKSSGGPLRGFGVHVNFNQDGSLQSTATTTTTTTTTHTPTANSITLLQRTPGRSDETDYVAGPMTPRSPRSDPGSAYISEVSDSGDRQSSVVMYGKTTDRSENHVV